MADVVVTITIPDALVGRVSEATGATNKSEFQDWVRARVKQAVVGHESQVASDAEQLKIKTAQDNAQTAVETAVASAETDIQLT